MTLTTIYLGQYRILVYTGHAGCSVCTLYCGEPPPKSCAGKGLFILAINGFQVKRALRKGQRPETASPSDLNLEARPQRHPIPY